MDFRAHLFREKYLNAWPGKMPFVNQVWEGRGGREQRGPVMASAEHSSGCRALC